MARIPRIAIPARRTTNQVPGRLISEGGATDDVLQILGETGQRLFGKLSQAKALAEKTRAQNDRDTRLLTIQTQAANDTDLSTERQRFYSDKINKAGSESSKLISIPDEKSIFELESQSKARISNAKIQAGFRKKIVEQGAADLDIFISKKGNEFIEAQTLGGKQSAILERNDKIREAVQSGYISGAEATKKIDELDKSWGKAQVDYDIDTNPEIALELLNIKAYPNISEKERVESIIAAKNMISKNKKEKKLQDQAAMQKNEIELYEGVINGTKSLRDINEAEARGSIGLGNGIRESVGADLRRLVTKGNTATPQQKADSFIELQDRFTDLQNKSDLTLDEMLTFRSDIVSAMAAGKIRDSVGEKWLKDTSEPTRELRGGKGAGWKAIKFWVSNIVLPADQKPILMERMGESLIQRTEDGKNELEVANKIIEEELPNINPNAKKYEINDIIETPLGPMVVKGFFPDGEPDVEPVK